MYLNTFLQDLNRLGLAQWEGIEVDHCMGSRHKLDGIGQAQH